MSLCFPRFQYYISRIKSLDWLTLSWNVTETQTGRLITRFLTREGQTWISRSHWCHHNLNVFRGEKLWESVPPNPYGNATFGTVFRTLLLCSQDILKMAWEGCCRAGNEGRDWYLLVSRMAASNVIWQSNTLTSVSTPCSYWASKFCS